MKTNITNIKYVFLDIVGYTHERTVESQQRILVVLNGLVRLALKTIGLDKDNVVILPTGDGMCIGCIGANSYDAHVRLALSILSSLEVKNKSLSKMDKFEVRVGVNQNDDNIVTDINGNRNIAGAGINIASRILGFADGSQILVSDSVYESLKYRDKYFDSFRTFSGITKHNLKINAHQLIKQHRGLNINEPKQFSKTPVKLTREQAVYLSYCVKLRKFLSDKERIIHSHVGEIMIYLSAHRDMEIMNSSDVDKPLILLHGEGDKTNEEVFEFYKSVDMGVQCAFYELLSYKLSKLSGLFERDLDYRFVNKQCVDLLKEQFSRTYARVNGMPIVPIRLVLKKSLSTIKTRA